MDVGVVCRQHGATNRLVQLCSNYSNSLPDDTTTTTTVTPAAVNATHRNNNGYICSEKTFRFSTTGSGRRRQRRRRRNRETSCTEEKTPREKNSGENTGSEFDAIHDSVRHENIPTQTTTATNVCCAPSISIESTTSLNTTNSLCGRRVCHSEFSSPTDSSARNSSLNPLLSASSSSSSSSSSKCRDVVENVLRSPVYTNNHNSFVYRQTVLFSSRSRLNLLPLLVLLCSLVTIVFVSEAKFNSFNARIYSHHRRDRFQFGNKPQQQQQQQSQHRRQVPLFSHRVHHQVQLQHLQRPRQELFPEHSTGSLHQVLDEKNFHKNNNNEQMRDTTVKIIEKPSRQTKFRRSAQGRALDELSSTTSSTLPLIRHHRELANQSVPTRKPLRNNHSNKEDQSLIEAEKWNTDSFDSSLNENRIEALSDSRAQNVENGGNVGGTLPAVNSGNGGSEVGDGVGSSNSNNAPDGQVSLCFADPENVERCGNDTNSCFYTQTKCNGVSDCPNGFDESVTVCGCLEHEFRCNETCIDKLLIVCDTKIDCEDGTDEENCETYVCPETHFKCNNHFCIPAENVCDFQNNCGDNSDEEDCSHRACWFGEYKCDNGQCIQAYAVCNGAQDCVDGSDEKQCHSQGRECSSQEYRCSNSRCIARGSLCDTVCDCVGSCEDEHNCTSLYTTVNGVEHCDSGQTVACSLTDDGKSVRRCLTRDHICDGHSDCARLFDDEYGCYYGGYTEANCAAMSNHFWCPVERRCMPITVRCNNIQECLDGYDELACVRKDCAQGEFQCSNGQCIDAALRCNSHLDCFDKSDEINCLNETLTCGEREKRCSSGQCIRSDFWCDHFNDCLDESDEASCGQARECDSLGEFRCVSGQCIDASNRCLATASPRSVCADGSHLHHCGNWTCASTDQIKCAGGHCVESQLRCNEKLDCPVLSDWADEQFCPFFCSRNKQCPCIDTTINCADQQLSEIPEGIEDQILRMTLKGNRLGRNLTLQMFNRLDRMHMIDLTDNQIVFIPPGLFRKLWKLRVLHLRKNQIEIIDSYTFTGLPSLGTLTLNGNRIYQIREFAFSGLTSLKTLDLSNQQISSLQKNSFAGLRSLKNLDLSGNHIFEIDDGVFSGLQSVISIDLNGNALNRIGSKAFLGLNSLKQITFDEFRFCCLLHHVESCLPEPDQFSSCEDLMSNTILRICIWVLGSIAMVGNLFVILWRLKYQTVNRVHSFLIINLALGDFLMGVYLLIIASVDAYYRGVYFIVDASWRKSSLCHFAGFLSTLSSEFSVFALLVITIDRLITITFPFRIYKMRMKDAKIIIGSLWVVAVILSGLPLLRLHYFDNFYGRSGVCLALHITAERPAGWEYSVFIFLALNLVSFALICGSYLWMFVAARNTQLAAARSKESQVQNRMARRMMFIVATDFWCWMPIIVLGIGSLFGVQISPQVFAWIAVFVLPLNAAVNPTLYTLSGLTFRNKPNASCASYVAAVAAVATPTTGGGGGGSIHAAATSMGSNNHHHNLQHHFQYSAKKKNIVDSTQSKTASQPTSVIRLETRTSKNGSSHDKADFL